MAEWQQELYLIADDLRGMANLTKQFAHSDYDLERADRMLDLVARIAALAEERDLADVREIFLAEPWLHVSPAIGVEAAVFNPASELLLVQRRDSGTWVLPGGLAEIGQTLAEAALRELWEEAGLRGEVLRLVALFDGRMWGTRATVHLIHPVFLVACQDPEPVPGSETLAAGFFPPEQLPSPLAAGHTDRIPKVIELVQSGHTYVDGTSSDQLALSMNQRPEE